MSSKPPDPKAPPPARASLFGGGGPPPAPDKSAKPSKRAPKPPRRSGGLSGILSGALSFLLIGAMLGLGAFVWGFLQATKTGPLQADKVVNIGREEDGGTIAEQLESAGVVDSATWFNIVTLLDGSRSALKRGEYAVKAGESMRQVKAQLASGKVLQHKLTIPEGLTSEQVLQRIRDADF